MLLGHFVVPPVKGDTPVPDLSGEVDVRLQTLKLTALVELELICLYQGVQRSHLQVCTYLKYGMIGRSFIIVPPVLKCT